MDETKKKHRLWNDAELKAATDGYLYMLQLEQFGIPFSVSEHSEMLLSGPLNQRNEASVRYRMRNISFVAEELNLPTLESYSAAPQVGKNVAEKIKQHLLSRPKVLERLRNKSRRTEVVSDRLTSQTILADLESIKKEIAQLRKPGDSQMGHNNPPDDMKLANEDIQGVVEAIDGLKAVITASEVDQHVLGELVSKIAGFGAKLFVWSGQRITDFTKSAAVTAGAGFGLWLTGLGETIVSTLSQTLQFLLS